MKYSKGSVWRKWDLHFHTPSSFDYADKSVSNQDIIDKLKSNNISVVAITDHHVIDAERIKALKNLAGEDITILPGIELRSEHAASSHLHYIGIFPEDIDIDYIWSKIHGKLDLSPQDVERKGNDSVYCHLDDASELIHDLGGIVSIHAGKKENSIENITNAIPVGHAIKEDILRDIDIFEMGKPTDIDEYNEKVIPQIKNIKIPPMILCSDNHNINEYRLKESCWIKADPTFKGLKQTIFEPEDRVFVGDVPPVNLRVGSNKTKYIDSIKIHADDAYADEHWFRDIQLEINPELSAIIGNKGNGKSALSDIIGLVGNTKNYNHFSFLNEQKFRERKLNKAKHFRGHIIWASADDNNRLLSENPEPHEQESVKYIPQKYLEILCNEERDEFDKELKKVIYSHVPHDQRLGYESLDELLTYKSEVIEESISISIDELDEVNTEIAKLEGYLDIEYKKSLEEKLKVKKKELEVHEKSKPTQVIQPETDPAKAEEIKKISEQLDKASADKKKVEEDIKVSHKQKSQFTRKKSVLEKALGDIENFKTQHSFLIERLSVDLEEFEIDAKELVSLEIKEDSLTSLKASLEAEIKTIDDNLSEENENSLINKREAIEGLINELKGKLDEPNQKYQAYLKELASWEGKKAEIIGDPETDGSIEQLTKHQKYIGEDVPTQLGSKREKRIEITKNIFDKKNEIVGIFKVLYKPVEDFIEAHKHEEYPVKFDARLEIEELYEGFFGFVSQKAKGSFYGREEGEKQLRELAEATDINDKEAVVKLLSDIIDKLEKDVRYTKDNERVVKNQLRKEDSLVEFYNYLFSLKYIAPKYTLRLGDTELNQLSPGEKGALLLIFYLMIDKNDIPLIIDQPEENLDNESVYKLLVNYIKIAKKRRQIIIVTHNPNLAVVCDAEQIIYSKIDKKDKNRVSYISGGIENPEITVKIIDVLEGTLPAFNNRENKYTLARLS